MGGIASTSIQKNIIQSDSGSFYTDIDWLFSLGNRGLERIISYGGRVDRIIPVGSMFMEYYWFTNLPKIIKKYDLILIDLNVIHAYNRMDSFKHFMDDYYNCNRWLVRLKKEYPSFRIGIKHHANASFDKIQNEIILDSNIEMIDKNLDSYEIAFNSHCAISYGSTMGFELSAHGLPFFFIDPGFRCTSLPDKEGDFISNLRVQTYEEFRDSVIEVLSKKDKTTTWLKNPDDLCLESSNVSNRIYNSLHSK
tara:strand:- start:676 stop:1428 length:753 start_codon:yes stop_codon:yes gene_type:complete